MAGNGSQTSLDPGGIESGIVGDGDGGADDQACRLVGIDPFADDIGIADASQPGDLRRDRCTGILEPLSDLTDPYDHTTGIEGDTLDRQIDDRMIRIEPDRLYVDHYSGADQPLRCDDGITGRWRQRAQHPVIDMRIEEGRGTLVR